MNIETKPSIFKGIIDVLKELGGVNSTETKEQDVVLSPEHIKTLNSIDNGKLKKQTESPSVNISSGDSEKNKFQEHYKASEETTMKNAKENLEKMKKILKREDYEKGK